MKNTLLFLLAILIAVPAVAQQSYTSGIKYTATVQKQGDNVAVAISSDLNNLDLGSTQMVVLTPEIRSNDGQHAVSFPSVVVAGNRRYKMANRELGFGINQFDNTLQDVIRHGKNADSDRVGFDFTAPYESWMRNASLVVNEEISGCPRCDAGSAEVVAFTPLLPPFVPEYRVTYVDPPAEDVKVRKEVHIARINYEVGRYTLLRDYKENAEVLNEVDRIMRELTGDDDLTVTKFVVTGYASPDGNYNSNMALSQNRAKAFMDYLHNNFGWNVANIDSEGKGEDWDGLYKAVEASSMAGRDEVLSIISDNSDITQRKARLHSLNGGQTYRVLLNEYFPPLRRNEYEIEYSVRPFSIEEAKEVIKTKPRLLKPE